MQLNLEMPNNLEEQLKSIVISATKKAIEDYSIQASTKTWLSLKEGAAYAGVSYNTLMKFREQKGLQIAEIDGIKRVSKKQIDEFLEKNSF